MLKVILTGERIIYADSKKEDSIHVYYYRNDSGLVGVYPHSEVISEREESHGQPTGPHPNRA